MSELSRRDFLQTTAGLMAGAGAALAEWDPVLAGQEESPAGLPRRPLGKTGEKVSIIGIGGWHAGSIPEREGIALMHEAIDEGVTFFDNAWDYHMGGSEEVMGKALASEGRRNKVFLMTKDCARDYEGSLKHLDDSLRRLRTDHLDLWQFHEINYPQDPDWLFERGAIKAALEAKKAGKVRFIGFTGHKDIDIHLRLISKPFAWDAVQMPINILDAHYRSFQKKVMPECNRRGIGVIGMKALACGAIPKELGLSAADCRRYALSQPISTLVCGMTSRENLRQDVGVARGFRPMKSGDAEALLAKTAAAGDRGQYERFKTTRQFDAEYHRRQHNL